MANSGGLTSDDYLLDYDVAGGCDYTNAEIPTPAIGEVGVFDAESVLVPAWF